MTPVSGVSTGVVQPLSMAEEARGASKVRRPEEEVQGRQVKPVMDEYVPEEPREPSGLYWMGRGEDGQPKICFDDPSRAADAPEQPEDAPEAGGPDPVGQGTKDPEGKGDKDEVWECNTGKADREIEKLKRKQQELEQRLHAETNEASARRNGNFGYPPSPRRGSRHCRWLKRSGANAPLLTGVWGRSVTNKLGSVYTEPLLAVSKETPAIPYAASVFCNPVFFPRRAF